MRNVRLILSSTLLIATLAASLVFVFAGVGNPQDPCYWLYKFQSLEGGWLSAGTILIGGALVRLFGAELLPLRLVGWLLMVLSIALPYFVLLNKQQRRENLHWLALTYGLMGYGAFQELSSGTLTIPFLSAIGTLMITYLRRPTETKRIVLGLLAGLAIPIRFPNILVLVVLVVFLWYCHRKELFTVFTQRIASVFFSAVIALALCSLSYRWIVPAPIDPSMENHSVAELLEAMYSKGALLIQYLLLWTAVLLLPRLDRPAFARYQSRHWVGGILIAALMVYIVAYTIPARQWYNTNLLYLISAGCIAITLFSAQRQYCWLLAILSIAALGTDVAWLKLFPAVLCLLPVVLPNMPSTMRQYLFPILAGLMIISFVRFTTNSVGSNNLYKTSVVSSISPYRHIRVTHKQEQWMLQVRADYDSLTHCTTHPILAVGQQNHKIRVLTGCQAALYNEFWSNIFDSVYTAKYQTIIASQRPIVFCAFTPQFKTKKTYLDRESVFEQMLLDHGYKAIDRSAYQYMIYIPDAQEIR